MPLHLLWAVYRRWRLAYPGFALYQGKQIGGTIAMLAFYISSNVLCFAFFIVIKVYATGLMTIISFAVTLILFLDLRKKLLVKN